MGGGFEYSGGKTTFDSLLPDGSKYPPILKSVREQRVERKLSTERTIPSKVFF